MPKREYSSRKLPEKLDDLNGKNVIRRGSFIDQGPGLRSWYYLGGVTIRCRSTQDINQGNKSGAYDDATRFHFIKVERRKRHGDGVLHFLSREGVQPLDSKERSVEILFIGSCVAVGIDDERRAAFSGAILLIGGIAK
ncbi:hypothetical protein HAX54_041601 [Datura stramonium]|uniref:Uncharacterized protein n=1 Tax=Datura stramonium TaxID=4076 RepID=A0ABS8VXX1_DATST|nr:hypothetical protein [Datura stramonium]